MKQQEDQIFRAAYLRNSSTTGERGVLFIYVTYPNELCELHIHVLSTSYLYD